MTHVHPDITCTKCSTVVPWGPHCPHCRAYLEFSGTPPWHPDAPEQSPSPEAATPAGAEVEATAPPDDAAVAEDHEVMADVDGATSALQEPDGDPTKAQDGPAVDGTIVGEPSPYTDDLQPLTESVLIAEAVTGVTTARHARRPEKQVTVEPGPWRLLQRGWRREPGRNLLASLFAVILALVISALLVLLSGTTAAWIAAPLFMLWGLVAVAIYGTIPDQRVHREDPLPFPITVEETILEQEALVDAPAVIVGDVDDDEIRSREPQSVEATAEKSKPLVNASSITRDVACVSCGHLNMRGTSFCAICGSVIADSRVAPDVIAYSLVEDDDTTSELTSDGKRKQRRRRISGSWRNAILALTLIGVVIGAFLFAFFGPGALRLQFGMAQAFQTINQWIDPYAGPIASVNDVKASSTLKGTNDASLKDSDARTFWASAPLPDYGAGVTLTFRFDEPTSINRMVIYPGVQNRQLDRRALGTPRDFTLTFDDGTSVAATLEELSGASEVRQLVKFPDVTTSSVALTINSVYPPIERTNDDVGEVALSGIDFLEVPQLPALFRFQQGSRVPGLPGLPGSSSN